MSQVPYFVWRDGRPRWVPGRHVRARGFKGRDLKDAAGNWLDLEAARKAAVALNEAVKTGKLPMQEPEGRPLSEREGQLIERFGRAPDPLKRIVEGLLELCGSGDLI